VNRFASGSKGHYYGKGDVIVYRLNRTGKTPAGTSPVFGASVLMLLYGDAFWQTYTTGDNTKLIATDSMKNFIQRETMNFGGHDLEGFCRFLAEKFLRTYPQVEGLQVSADEIPYASIGATPAFVPAGPERAFARIELGHKGLIEATSGLKGFKLLRLGGSAFKGFVRDQYTTLPDLNNRPLHMWLDLDWSYTTAEAAFNVGAVTNREASSRSFIRWRRHCSPISPQLPKFVSRRTIARGIRLSRPAMNWGCTPTPARLMGVWGLR
jgi:urate oxidase/2-oxo-4-hydroxy-4-carboxy-5-ureidoimidazoline decarboxylase